MKRYFIAFLISVFFLSCSVQHDKRHSVGGIRGFSPAKKPAVALKDDEKADHSDKDTYADGKDTRNHHSDTDPERLSEGPEAKSGSGIAGRHRSKNRNHISVNRKSSFTETEAVDPETDLYQDAVPVKNSSDKFLYGLAALMGLSAFGLFRKYRRSDSGLARWAKSNRLKSAGLITLANGGLCTLGVLTGNELFRMDHLLTDTPQYLFGGLFSLMLLSSAGDLFRKKSERTNHTKTLGAVTRKRLMVAAMSVSLFVSSASVGNRLSQGAPSISPMGHVLSELDQHQTEIIPEKTESKNATHGNGMLIFGYVILALLLLALVTALACAMICLAAFEGAFVLTFLAVVAAVGLLALFVVAVKAMVADVRSKS